MPATEPDDDASAAGQAGDRTNRGGRNLPVAIGVGLSLAVAYIGSLLLHPLLFLAFVSINIVIALYELDAAFGRSKAKPPTIVAAVTVPIAFLSGYEQGSVALVNCLFGALLAGFVLTMLTHERGRAVARMGALTLMLLWVVLPAASLSLLLARPEGHWYVMAGTALAVTNDIGAYAFGRNFGRRKLAPGISPAKTVEGLLGALVTTLAMALLVTAQVVPEVDWVVAACLAMAIVVASTVGDLAESMLKRDLGVKDLGRVFPGHGGVMDRIDALLFALPTTHLVLLAFGI